MLPIGKKNSRKCGGMYNLLAVVLCFCQKTDQPIQNVISLLTPSACILFPTSAACLWPWQTRF
jgi:hypothetical protein